MFIDILFHFGNDDTHTYPSGGSHRLLSMNEEIKGIICLRGDLQYSYVETCWHWTILGCLYSKTPDFGFNFKDGTFSVGTRILFIVKKIHPSNWETGRLEFRQTYIRHTFLKIAMYNKMTQPTQMLHLASLSLTMWWWWIKSNMTAKDMRKGDLIYANSK